MIERYETEKFCGADSFFRRIIMHKETEPIEMHKELVEIKEPATPLVVMVAASLATFILVTTIGVYIAAVYFSGITEKIFLSGVISGCVALFLSLVVFSTLNKGSITIYGLGVEREE